MARQIGKMLNTREPKIISGPGTDLSQNTENISLHKFVEKVGTRAKLLGNTDFVGNVYYVSCRKITMSVLMLCINLAM